MVRESTDPIQVLCGSCNGKWSNLSLLFVACVSHELVHARKNLVRDDEYEGMNKQGLNCRLRLSLPRGPA